MEFRRVLFRSHLRVEDELDLRVRLGTIDQDRLRAQLAAPVDDVHLRRVAGEEISLFHRRVTPAHDGQLLALEKRPVAAGAVADPPPPQLLLPPPLPVPPQPT